MCLAGCSSDSGEEAAQQSGSSGAGAGTSNGGSTQTCRPFVIESETVATTPGARTRTRIGIGEEVKLTTDPTTTVTWTIESDDGQKGTLTKASGDATRYEACDRAKTVTIKAESACGRTDTHRLTVVEPSSGGFGTDTDISAITATTIKVGFQAPPAMGPADVNFYNCEMREGTCMSTSSGPLQVSPERQHADTGSWVGFTNTVGTIGTEVGGNDTVYGQYPLSSFPAAGTTDGQFFWPIPWRAQVRGGGTNGAIVFDTLNHDLVYTASSRDLTQTKGNRSKQRTVP